MQWRKQRKLKQTTGIELVADDVIANLIGHEDDFDALVFACGGCGSCIRSKCG